MPERTRVVKNLTYVIADLHGRYDLLHEALTLISDRGGKTIVFLGDYIDRGLWSSAIIERLIKGPPEGQTWICLKGNHEDLLVLSSLYEDVNPIYHSYERDRCQQSWLDNGGIATLTSYGSLGKTPDLFCIPKAHVQWMANLPLCHLDDHRIYVHAGATTALKYNNNEQYMLNVRYAKDYNVGYGSRHMVHGHTPYEDGPLLLSNRTDLDTLAFDTGRLVIGVFDNAKAGGPVEVIEIRNPTEIS